MKLVKIWLLAGIICGFAAACGGGTSCEDAVDNALKRLGMGGGTYGSMRAEGIKTCKDEKWSAKKRSCFAKASSMKDMDKCDEADKGGGGDSGGGGAKRSEAELNLNQIMKSAKTYFAEKAEFPKVSAGLTPGKPCCEFPDHKCPATTADWSGVPAWDELDFEIVEPSYFQYSYESTDGIKAVARAVGDLDCDGTSVEYKVEMDSSGGSPTMTLSKPSNPD